MDWFQRYGIPGTVFWGFLILWIVALNNNVIPETICSTDIEKAKIIAAIAAGTFLPIGYLMVIIGQLIYHLFPGFGMDTRARYGSFWVWIRLVNPINDKPVCNSWFEWKQEACSVNHTFLRLWDNNKLKGDNNNLQAEGIRLISEWMSKRMGMVVINLASILAVIAAISMSLLLRRFFEIEANDNKPLFLFATFISILLPCIWGFSWLVLTMQLVKIERLWLQYLDVDNLSRDTITRRIRQQYNEPFQRGASLLDRIKQFCSWLWKKYKRR